MILQRLYELARRENLLDDPAFEEQPVPYVVKLDRDGQFLGIEERRGTLLTPAKKKGAEPRAQPDKGQIQRVPRPHGNPNQQGFARYFADTLPRVLPVALEEKDRAKAERSRATFWQQIGRAAQETADPALQAVAAFGQAVQTEPRLGERIRAELAACKAGVSDRCTFAWSPDQGTTILDRPSVRRWFGAFYAAFTGAKQAEGPCGVCQVTGVLGPLPTSHAIRLAGVPGGLPTGVSLVSNDKAAFESYGLEGAANAGVGYEAADGYLRALTALIQHRLKDNPPTSLRVGDVLFLFWTQRAADLGFMNLLELANPAEVETLLRAVPAGKEDALLADPNQFYLLGLSGNAARAIVREYLERPLGWIKANLARWFADLTIADATRDGVGRPTCRFPLAHLAVATALDFDNLAPATAPSLLRAALTWGPVAESVLAACLGRLRAEGRDGFRPARLALIKLILLRREVPVTATLDDDERHPAYLYGRLLAVFEQIQFAALGDVNANVVDKFYGTFSAAPALVFSRLFANAQNHLRKLRGDKPGAHVVLDRLLTEVADLLGAGPPCQHLSLKDQGRFALGYYHQKARRFEEIAERKAKAATETV